MWVCEEKLAVENGQSEGDRLISFMQSREYTIFVLRNKITEVKEMAQQIKSAQKVANITKESIMWTFMVQALQDDGIKYALEQLAAKGVITKTDLKTEMGFNWLKGNDTGEVQLLWGL